MADSSALTSLQLDLLRRLGSVDGAFLSGGSCLAFGYFGHRRSYDLDFFCASAETVTEVAGRLTALCAEQAWTLESERAWPGFRRFQVKRGVEATIVDIVHDTAVQLVPVSQKPEIEGIRIDDLRDLLANKLCAALGRSEVKDLVDLFAMEAHGLDLLAAIGDAERKEGGRSMRMRCGRSAIGLSNGWRRLRGRMQPPTNSPGWVHNPNATSLNSAPVQNGPKTSPHAVGSVAPAGTPRSIQACTVARRPRIQLRSRVSSAS